MSSILHRRLDTAYPVAAGGEGPYLFDREGRAYLDASGGAAVSCLGHGHPAVIDALKTQLDRMAYAHTAFFTNEPAEALAEHLTATAPGALNHVYFVSGGSEANETALKLARQYAVERGAASRVNFIARRQSYHGNTLGALGVGGNPKRRTVFDGILAKNTIHIAPCYAYRGQAPGESAEAYGQRVADELETAILAAGPETVCAFICEPVVGATLGAVPAVRGYLKRIREICTRYGVLMILDEVMCGMGRTGTLYACEQDGVVPDLLTCAKGLGGGYQPIGAVLIGDPVVEAIRAGSGGFEHGFTYIGHATACAGALAVQQTIAREGLLANVARQGAALQDDLRTRFAATPEVADIRGRGLFVGLELVRDPAAKTPFPAESKLNARIKAEAMARGLICYPGGGTADGWRGDHILLAPPFILTDAHRAELVDKLGAAVDAALKAVGDACS